MEPKHLPVSQQLIRPEDAYDMILRGLVIEMAVERLSAPDGLAHRLLETYREAGALRPPPDAHSLNGNHKNGATQKTYAVPVEYVSAPTEEQLTLPGVSDSPPRRGRPRKYPPSQTPLPATENGKRVNPRMFDAWGNPQWTAVILKWATEHGGIFSYKHYRDNGYRPEEHNGISFGRSKVHSAMSWLRMKKFVKGTKDDGVYALTPAGIKYANFPELPPRKYNQHTQPREDGKLSLREHMIQFAQENGNRFATAAYYSEYAKYYNKPHSANNSGAIFAMATSLVKKGAFKRVGPGIFTLVNAAKGRIPPKTEATKAPPVKERQPGVDLSVNDMLVYAREHGGEFNIMDYKLDIKKRFKKFPSAGLITGRLKRHQDLDEIEFLGKGRYKYIGEAKEAEENEAAE